MSFALIHNGAIIQIEPASFEVAPGLDWADLAGISPSPQIGWQATEPSGVWTFTEPEAPTLSLPQQARLMMMAGLAIASTGTPALDATYPTDDATQSHIQAEIVSILVNNTFADGTTTLVWPDIEGTNHTFPDTTTFRAFATKTSAFVAALFKVINGSSTSLPSASETIP